jgi:uncharacterized membrane protein
MSSSFNTRQQERPQEWRRFHVLFVLFCVLCLLCVMGLHYTPWRESEFSLGDLKCFKFTII